MMPPLNVSAWFQTWLSLIVGSEHRVSDLSRVFSVQRLSPVLQSQFVFPSAAAFCFPDLL